jgi:ABC-type multidrug transport system ATPase subunit
VSAPLLTASGLTVRFPAPLGARAFFGRRPPPRTVLTRIDLALHPGEVVGILGANGAGKSTLLRALTGLVAPADGSITRGAGIGPPALGVADERSFHWRLTVAENLRFFAELQGAPVSAVGPALSQVGLTEQAEMPVRVCSSGMRARLGLARALLRDPALLLLDEVERGLDVAGRARLRDLLTARAERGTAALCATHDPTTAPALTRAVVLRAGHIVFDGDPQRAFAALEPGHAP